MRAGRLLLWLLCLAAASCVSVRSLAQPKFVIIPQLAPFSSLSVARRINVTLVSNTEIDKLPVEVYGRLVKNKKAIANIEAGGRACVIKAEPSVAKAVRCDVADGGLVVYAEKFKYSRSPAIDVFVVCDDALSSISGTSSSNIYSKGVIRSPGLSVTADFAMSIHISVLAPCVSVVAKHDSEVWLTGAVDNFSAELNGSSLLMRQMSCGAASVTATNGSKAQVNASRALSLSAVDHSAVTYLSQGATVHSSADATSKVEAIFLPK